MRPTPITLIRARSNPSAGFVEADESTGTILSEHQQQTEFLSQCLLYDDTAKSHQLGARIAQLQEDERRVRRGVRLMAGLGAVAVAGLCYSAVFLGYYPENFWGFTSHIITQVFCVLGLVATVCLLSFIYLGMNYRNELDVCREKCRQRVTELLESRLGKPVATPLRETRDQPAGEGQGRAVHGANEVNGVPLNIESAARG